MTELATGPAGGPAHSVWRERLIAGVAAATLVVCWFVLFDQLTVGAPWLTARRIGGAAATTVAAQAYRAHPGLVRYELAHIEDEV